MIARTQPVSQGRYICVPPQLEGVVDYACRDCCIVARLEVPQKVIRIGDHAFDGCEGKLVYDHRVRLDI